MVDPTIWPLRAENDAGSDGIGFFISKKKKSARAGAHSSDFDFGVEDLLIGAGFPERQDGVNHEGFGPVAGIVIGLSEFCLRAVFDFLLHRLSSAQQAM